MRDAAFTTYPKTYRDLTAGEVFQSPRAEEGRVTVVCPPGRCTHDTSRDEYGCHVRGAMAEFFVNWHPGEDVEVVVPAPSGEEIVKRYEAVAALTERAIRHRYEPQPVEVETFPSENGEPEWFAALAVSVQFGAGVEGYGLCDPAAPGASVEELAAWLVGQVLDEVGTADAYEVAASLVARVAALPEPEPEDDRPATLREVCDTLPDLANWLGGIAVEPEPFGLTADQVRRFIAACDRAVSFIEVSEPDEHDAYAAEEEGRNV